MENLDSVKLNFDANGLFLLNISLAIVMFGVALGISLSDFRAIVKSPKPLLVGLISQFLLLPALTFLLMLLLKPDPSIALGMILVAACPGGNISNFMTFLAKGNTALSVSLTAFSTMLCIFLTPLNLQFWGSLYGPTEGIIQEVSLNFLDMLKTIILILGIPLIIGMTVKAYKENLANRLTRILKPLSILIFLAIVFIAFSKNTQIFLDYIKYVVLLVFLHNAMALALGYSFARVLKLDQRNRRTIAIETGIQNSGLGLILIFGFFEGLGGMAIVAAWWGIWHILSGLSVAFFWSTRAKSLQEA